MASVTLSANKNLNIFGLTSDTNEFGLEYLMLYDRVSFNRIRRILLEFLLSSIPTGSTINSATLRLNYYEYGYTDPVGKTAWAYKLTRTDWIETQATWNSYKTGSAWTNAGGDYVTSDPSGGSLVYPSGYGWLEWDVSAIVQDAFGASNPAEMLLKFNNEEAPAYSITYQRSKEWSTNTPELVVEYTIALAFIPRVYII